MPTIDVALGRRAANAARGECFSVRAAIARFYDRPGGRRKPSPGPVRAERLARCCLSGRLDEVRLGGRCLESLQLGRALVDRKEERSTLRTGDVAVFVDLEGADQAVVDL